MSKTDQPNTPHRRTTRPWSIAAVGSMFTLFASQSVHAADGTTLGVPSWIFVVLAIIILGAVCLMPMLKKKPNKTTISKDLLKPTPQKPIETKKPVAPSAEAKKPVVTPVAPAPVAPEPVAKVEPVVAPAPAPAPEPAPLDAMVEAKQFLDQQRIPQAVGVLSKGLQREPERTDIILELLTIYSKQNHHEAFEELFEQLAKLDDPLALIQAEELRDQLIPIVVEDDRGIIEYQKTQPPVAETAEAEPAPVAEIEHDTLAFTLDEVADTQPVESAPAAKAEEFDLSDFGTDHSFELEKVESISPAEQDNALDFTFGDDLIAPEPAPAPAPETISDLEFKLPEAVVETAPAPAPVEAKKADSDLVDLEFDLDDSFALDDGHTEQESAKSQSWTTDLGSEDFAPAAKAATPAPVAATPVTAPAAGTDPLLSTLDEEFPFLSDMDPQQTCLELAKSYISLSETDSARELLDQVIEMGNANQQTEARALIAKLAS